MITTSSGTSCAKADATAGRIVFVALWAGMQTETSTLLIFVLFQLFLMIINLRSFFDNQFHYFGSTPRFLTTYKTTVQILILFYQFPEMLQKTVNLIGLKHS